MKVASALRTAAIVLPITAIVWVVADRSVLRTSSKIAAGVTVNCSDPNYRLTLVEPAGGEMTVQFTGPGRGIDRVLAQRPRLRWEYELSSAEAARAAAVEPYLLSLSAREGFARLADEHRVTLTDADPSGVVIRVEKVGRKTVPVELSTEDRRQLAEGYKIEPAEVKVVGTARVLSTYRDGGLWAVPAIDLERPRLLDGKSDRQVANLRPNIAGLGVTFEPPSVTVSDLRLTALLDRRTIEEKIRIEVLGPPEVLQKYDVTDIEPAPEIANLKIIGPRTEVHSVRAEDVRAVLVLTPTDKPNPPTPTSRPLEIWFPRHSHVRLDNDPRQVNFTLRERPGPPPE